MVSLSGAIPRVEAQWSHTRFVEAVGPDHVMLGIDHANRIYDTEVDDSPYPDETSIITTTTIKDEKLARSSWEAELEVVETTNPAYHIPTDYPVYGDDLDEERIENARQCATGTLWIAEQLSEDSNTELIPLIKGTTERERDWGYRACEALGADLAAVYAAQYFLVGGGGGRAALIRDLDAIYEETDGNLDILVIGLLSPNYLSHLPENVVAAAGQNTWREPVAPRKQDEETMTNIYHDLSEKVAQSLSKQ